MKRARNIVTVVLLVVSVAMIVAGVVTGEPETVLSKAINVCMECIGIG